MKTFLVAIALSLASVSQASARPCCPCCTPKPATLIVVRQPWTPVRSGLRGVFVPPTQTIIILRPK